MILEQIRRTRTVLKGWSTVNDENLAAQKGQTADDEKLLAASDVSSDEKQDGPGDCEEPPVEAIDANPEGLKETPALEEDETSLVNTENS